MPRLNNENRNWILGFLETGILQIEVARRFNVARSKICRLARRVRQTGTVAYRPRPGQARVTSRQDNYIRQRHLRDRFQTAAATASVIIGNRGRQIHRRTVSRRLKEFGIRYHIIDPY